MRTENIASGRPFDQREVWISVSLVHLDDEPALVLAIDTSEQEPEGKHKQKAWARNKN